MNEHIDQQTQMIDLEYSLVMAGEKTSNQLVMIAWNKIDTIALTQALDNCIV